MFERIFRGRKPQWFEQGGGPRREGRFSGIVRADGATQKVLGTSLAHEGVAIVAERAIEAPEFELAFTVREHPIVAHLAVLKDEPMRSGTEVVHRYWCRFVAIAADDWDLVVRAVDGIPEPDPATLASKPDDDFRSLPKIVQDRIVEFLVRAGKLDSPSAGALPLIRLRAGTARTARDGTTSVEVRIESRAHAADGESVAFDSAFRVHADGRIEVLG